MTEPEILTYMMERADSGVYSTLDENDHLDYHNNMNLVFSSLHNEMKSQMNLKQFTNQKKIDQNQLDASHLQDSGFDSSTRKKSVSLMRFISHENDQLISLQDAQHILNLFLNNHFERADNLAEKYLQYQSNVLYIKFVRAVCAFLQAIIIQDKATYENAQKYVRECFELCLKRRPRRGLNLFNNNLHSAKVNFYSEQEIHAELCYADCQLLLLALDSISNGKDHLDQIFNSVKLKACFNAYKSCYEILQKRTFYQNENSRNEFKLGVFFGLGIINMFTQDLPVPIQASMKFDQDLSFDYETALEDASSQPHIRQMLAIIFQTIYKIHHQETFGECHNFDALEQTLRHANDQYSGSCILHYLDGRYKQLTGQHAAAINDFETCFEICLTSNTLIRPLQYHCEYGLAICFAVKKSWLRAADAALFLTNSSQQLYSPILTRYMYCVFMQMHFFFINYNLYDSWNGYLENNLGSSNHEIEFKLTNADSNTECHVVDCGQERSGGESGCSSRTERSESLTYSTSRTNSMTDSLNNIMTSASWKKLDDVPFQDVNDKSSHRYIDEKLEHMTEREFNEELVNHFNIISKFKLQHPKGKQLSAVEILCVINANKYLSTGRLVLPAIELFYWLDIFSYLKERKDLVNSIIKLIEIELIEEDELKDEPNADMDNFSLLYLLKGVCLATNQEYDQAIKCFKEILYCEKRIKRDKHILHFGLLQLPLVLIKNSKHLEALYYLDKEKELCRDDLAKLFGQVTSASLNVQKIFTAKVMQLEQALSELNGGQEIEKRKLSKKRNSIAAIQLNTFNNQNTRRASTNHLKQLFRQKTLTNILYKDEYKDGFKDSLLEANLAKRCNQSRRSSLSDFIKNSLFGS